MICFIPHSEIQDGSTTITPGALPASEAAKYMGIPKGTFDRLVKTGAIPSIRFSRVPVFRIAAYWSMSELTFAGLVAAGVVSGRKVGPRMIRYAKSDLDAASETFPTGKGDRPSA